ncbi:MAG: hypothetical protein JXA13_00425 [Anaerolineales bacterium]|nr:hypothetical protein [Anaerolineales bacterium]
MPDLNSSEEITSAINSLQSKLRILQETVQLTNIRDTVEDMLTTVNNLDKRVTDLRNKGYAFNKNLEDQAENYRKQWEKLYPPIEKQITAQVSVLRTAFDPLELQMRQLAQLSNNPTAARPSIRSLETSLKTMEDKVDASERTISGMYDQFYSQLNKIKTKLYKLEWMMTELAEASFQLLPTESGIMAVKAVWVKTGEEQKGDPEGILYLTDQRLLFEQKEKVATKKVLFIATEKETVQELLLEIPLSMVDGIEISKHGLMKNEDHINLKLATGAPMQTASFHIWQANQEWQALINRAKAKEFDKDRALEIDQEILDKISSAPTQCPSCGGNINQVVLRGMDSIKCEFCGFTIRL